jgi:CheY-like chemotaxis protein
MFTTLSPAAEPSARPSPASSGARVAAPPVQTAAAAQAASDRPTVLVADDEDQIRRLVSQVLTDLGLEVLQARDGREALRVAAAHRGRLSLVVTDVMMPGLTGPELASELGWMRPDAKVVFMSGYVEDAEFRRQIQDGGAEFLHKPFSLASLCDTVTRLIG